MTSYEWQRSDGGFTLSPLTTRNVRSCDKNCEIYYVASFCSFHSLWRNTRGSLGTNTNNKVNITLNTVTIIRSTPKLFFCLDTLESKSHIKKKTKIHNPLNYDFITKLANHQQAIEGIDFWNMKLEAPFVTPVTLKIKSPQATTVRITREV